MSSKTAAQALGLLLGCAALTTATGTLAQTAKDAYVQDARGVIVRNSNVGDPRIGNLCYRTGYWTPAMSIAECDPDIAPKPVAVTPPPKPTPPPPAKPVPPPPPKPCDFTMTLDNDATFEFNKAVLNNAARKELDEKVVRRAAGTCGSVSLLLITGHTDRIGSQQYNQKLSEKRGNAVADYLKTKGMTVTDVLGAGKTLPIKACDDKLPQKELIACLAPNRRVVVEVRGPAK